MVGQEFDEGLPLEKVKDFSLEELLAMAIKAEIGARKFYESLAERIEIHALKDKIEWLAGEEGKHEALLRKMYESMFSGKEVIYPKEHIGPELQPVARELHGAEDILELIRWAIRAEDIAAKFYAEIENLVDTDDKKRLMRYLSDMEKGHYYTLKAEYELLLDWEMYSQMMHVGP
ncbi:rubrerythrin-related protein [Thermococcus sp. 4557]|uniref:ferritin family protein n=1 Tax=Thermococcus sp. (strain CGMCC 1.5172 / 4557) TaxID=1042877 RepID=UPI000219E8D2|nr:ferritin family protein [Thermococcus sp. 4557]AEK72037.1 rubrerythrin-related protein [Thermococcus sp. 4557]